VANSLATQHGHTLVEMLVVLALLATTLMVTVPFLADVRGAAELQVLSSRLAAEMYRARAYATMRGRTVSLVFERRGERGWRCFIAEDGDGDGVLRRDLDRGTDRILGEVLQLEGEVAGLGILAVAGVPDPNGRGFLRGNMEDPVRAGRGDIISFTPAATATPSSIYLTDHRARMRVLRVYGGTARVYSLAWRKGWQRWRKTGF
jgi:prepilin-type N-terminal cleavage/methylation domain-containing protein